MSIATVQIATKPPSLVMATDSNFIFLRVLIKLSTPAFRAGLRMHTYAFESTRGLFIWFVRFNRNVEFMIAMYSITKANFLNFEVAGR